MGATQKSKRNQPKRNYAASPSPGNSTVMDNWLRSSASRSASSASYQPKMNAHAMQTPTPAARHSQSRQVTLKKGFRDEVPVTIPITIKPSTDAQARASAADDPENNPTLGRLSKGDRNSVLTWVLENEQLYRDAELGEDADTEMADVSYTAEEIISRWNVGKNETKGQAAEHGPNTPSYEKNSMVGSQIRENSEAMLDVNDNEARGSSDESDSSSAESVHNDDEDGNCSKRRQFKEKERERRHARELRGRHRQRVEDEEEEDEAVGRAADRLLPFYVEKWDGCGKAKHAEALQKHNLLGTEHHYLEDTYDPFRQTKRFAATVGLGTDRFPRQTGVPRSAHPAAVSLATNFEGTPDTSCQPKNVCLHLEHDAVGTYQSFSTTDTDSLIIFPDSLRALRKPLMLCAVYDNTRHIQKALHMPQHVKVRGDDGKIAPASLEFRDLPQTYLGYMQGPLNVVMLGFPRLYSKNQANNFLTKAQEEQLYNLVVRPAITKHSLPGDVGYLPRTQYLADVDAKARSREQRSRHNDKKQMHHFTIPRNRNGDVWDTMIEIIDSSPALAHFQDPVILVDFKGIKAQTSQFDFWESMDDTDDMLEELFDEEFIDDDRFALDLGAIAAALSPDPMIGLGRYTEDAITNNWRRCCIEGILGDFKRDGFDEKSPSSWRIFVVGMLWEAVCMNFTPPKRCYLSDGGLLFGQFYGCDKTLFDAMGCAPYQSDTVGDVCVDHETYRGAASATRSTGSRQYEAGFTSAEESKARIRKVLTCEVYVSHGIRLEMRIKRKLWRAIKRRARRYNTDTPSVDALYTQGGPEAAWAISTSAFTRYLYGNYDKYISLLEMSSVTTPGTGRSIERSRFMRVVVQCIQQLFNSYYPQFPALWVSKREAEGVTLRGLGFETTLQKYGYAWIRRNIIDWENFKFRSKVGPNLAGHIDKRLLSWYPSAHTLVIQHTEGRVDCIRFLKSAARCGELEKEIFLLLAHKLLRAYRGDVLLRLDQARGIQSEARTRVAEDSIPFTWESLSSVLINMPNAMSGVKMTATTPHELFEWLWGDKSSHIRGHTTWLYKRGHWENLGYRNQLKVLQNNMRRIDERGEMYERFVQVLYTEFFTYHWTVPYPDPGGAFISKTKTGARQVWNVGIGGVFTKTFYWGKKDYIVGNLPLYPRVCKLLEGELRNRFQDLEAIDNQASIAKDIR